MSEVPVVVPTGASLPVLQAPQPVVSPIVVGFPFSAAVSTLPATDTVPDKVVEPPTSSSLTISKYNDKAVVVRGDTKKYRGNFQASGGKWNPRLVGGGGWIFPLTNLTEVQGLIDGIKAGAIKPIQPVQHPKTQYQQQSQVMYPPPYGMQQPYMMPQQMPYGMPPQQMPYGATYQQIPQVPQMYPQSQVQHQHHKQRSDYQTVTYNVYKPQMGMTAKVTGDGANFDAKVISVTPNPDGTVTKLIIQILNQDTTFEVGLWNGHWALRGIPNIHSIRFEH
jgi:hypothetical protein